jgi:hypothetical protein
MSTFSNFARHAFAAAAAFAITASLLVSSFATAPQVQGFAGILA